MKWILWSFFDPEDSEVEKADCRVTDVRNCEPF